MSKHSRSSICKLLLLPAAPLVLAGCLSPRAGQDATTDVVLTSDTGADGSSSGGPGGSTQGGIMTTTEEPESDSGDAEESTADDETTSTTTGATTTTTTTDIPPNCGDGILQEPEEECDNGRANNADDAACTLACKEAVCGDGLIQAGIEACDDHINDGAYDGCMPGCQSVGPFCGDLVIDAPQEQCDQSTPTAGCVKDACLHAASCLVLKVAWGDAATDGMYKIWPKPDEPAVDVYCDMTTDGGGYTFLKFAGPDLLSAAEAEVTCSAYGLRLLVPRTAAHLAATAEVAFDNTIAPIGGLPNPQMESKYLNIFGIYPKVPGESCVGQALNKPACPEWHAGDDEPYWVTGESVANQPGTSNCDKCSMAYYWDDLTKMLTGYEAFLNSGLGATSQYFLCDVGDKRQN